MIAALSEGIVERLPTREGIFDGPGNLEWRFPPARAPLADAGRELVALPELPLPVILAVPVDLRLLDLLPAEELDLTDDLLPTLPSSLRLALRDCKDGKLLCLDSSDLRLLLLLVAARPLVVAFAVAGRRGLLAPFDLTRLGILAVSSPSDSVSISSAKSTSGALFLLDNVCVPDDLVGDPTAIVPRLAMTLVLVLVHVAVAVADAAAVFGPGRLPAAGDRDLARPVLLVLPVPVVLALPAGRRGDRERALELDLEAAAVGDLALIASARALAALVIRTGDLDLAALLLELALVLRVGAVPLAVRTGDLERPLLLEAEADLVVRRTGDLGRVRVAVLSLSLSLPTASLAAILVLVFLAFALALGLTLASGLAFGTTTAGRFGES